MLARRKSKKLITIFLILTLILSSNIPFSYAAESTNTFPVKKFLNGESELSAEQVSTFNDKPVYLAKSNEKITDLKLYMPAVAEDESWSYHLGSPTTDNEMDPVTRLDELDWEDPAYDDNYAALVQELSNENYCWELEENAYKRNKEAEAATIQSQLGDAYNAEAEYYFISIVKSDYSETYYLYVEEQSEQGGNEPAKTFGPLKKILNGETALSAEQVSTFNDKPVYLAKSNEKITDLKLYMPAVAEDESWSYHLGSPTTDNEMDPVTRLDELDWEDPAYDDNYAALVQELSNENYCWELEENAYKRNKEAEAATIQSQLGDAYNAEAEYYFISIAKSDYSETYYLYVEEAGGQGDVVSEEMPEVVDGVYQIENAGQLLWFCSLVRGDLTDVDQNEAAKAKLVQDIDMEKASLSAGWNTFRGELDGNGKKLYNLKLSDGATSLHLFRVNYGVIKDLGIEFNSERIMAYNFGAICERNYGQINNCYLRGNLIVDVTAGSRVNIGGLASFNESTGIISSSYFDGDIVAKKGSDIGGICAYNAGLVEKCYHKGDIIVSGLEELSSTNVGGIVGLNMNQSRTISGTVDKCYNLGIIHNTGFWDSSMFNNPEYFGNWAGAAIFPIAGNNNLNDSSQSNQLGTVTDCYYLDYIPSTKANGSDINVGLTPSYRAYASNISGTKSIAGWMCTDQFPFTVGDEYYAYYDTSNDHFIVVGYSDAPSNATGVIDAKNPSDTKVLCTMIGPTKKPQKDFYYVTVPIGTTSVTFMNTERIVDYTLGMNNTFFNVYNLLAHSSYVDRTMLNGTPVTASNLDFVLSQVKANVSTDAYEVIANAFSVMQNDIIKGGEVTDDNITVTFRLVGATLGDVDYDRNLNNSKYVTWISTKSYTVPKNSTVKDVFDKACKEAGITYKTAGGTYVSSITAPKALNSYELSEFTNGFRSGWMYTVDGKHPSVDFSTYVLSDKESIVWHYVNDYSYEVSDWWDDDPAFPQKGNVSTWDPWLKVADVDPTANMGEETQPVTQDVTASVKDGEATSKVTASDVDKLVDAAVKQSATTIGINVKGADKADKVTVELPKASVSDIANKTNAALQVTTPQGIVNMDQAAMKEAVKAASGSDLTIVLEKQSVADESKDTLGSGAAQTKVSILSGGKEITDLGSGKVKISLPVTSDLKDKDLAAVYTDSEGKLVKVSGKLVTIDGKQYYQIETSRPETFVLAEAAKVDAAIKAQGGETDEEKLERIKAGVEGTAIQLRSKLNKRSIKLTWTKSKGYKVDGYQLYRSTKKSSGYKKYVTTKKLTYTNKAKLKKGTRYYYKVRGYRVIDGKTYYTQWSNKAYRLMKANSVDYGVKKTTVKAKAAASKGSVKVTWTKSKGYKVDGYQVYRSTSKTKNFKKLGTTAKKTFKNTKSLKKGKTYYYKVRGYRVLDGKKVYTKWSTTISVKAQ